MICYILYASLSDSNFIPMESKTLECDKFSNYLYYYLSDGLVIILTICATESLVSVVSS